ncbi:transcription termination/antitermination NusG family protein, partial [Sporofaciens musculi]|uniref:transcription termination/antitermination NusG family protein n=1 Tax=Sporofaciens musculi TaxID=2681861 RepID=UPI00256FDF78
MIDIWYLLYCPRQNERKILNSFKQNMSKAALKDAFIFTYDRMRKFQGKWHVEKQLMFPGYVFLESDNEGALAEEWQQYKGVANLLQEKNAILHVQKKEELFL